MMVSWRLSVGRYRRSYDSDYEAGLVAYHVWPCLMQEHKVLVKGEAHTARASGAVYVYFVLPHYISIYA